MFTQVVRLLYTIEALSLELCLSMTELPILLFHKLMKLLMSVIIFFFALLLKKIVEYLKILKDIIKDDCIITDVGSVKGNIHRAVKELGLEKNF